MKTKGKQGVNSQNQAKTGQTGAKQVPKNQYNAPGFPGLIAPGCSSSRPSSNQRTSCSVSILASVSVLGQRNTPLSSLLYKSRNPSPSQSSPLIRSRLRPQNRNRLRLYGSRDSVPCTRVASPSIPLAKIRIPGDQIHGHALQQFPHHAFSSRNMAQISSAGHSPDTLIRNPPHSISAPDEDPTKGVSALRIGTTAVTGAGVGTGQDRTDRSLHTCLPTCSHTASLSFRNLW